MKRLIILLSFVLGLSGFASAQDYSTGVGLRGGPFVGLSVKHFVKHLCTIITKLHMDIKRIARMIKKNYPVFQRIELKNLHTSCMGQCLYWCHHDNINGVIVQQMWTKIELKSLLFKQSGRYLHFLKCYELMFFVL